MRRMSHGMAGRVKGAGTFVPASCAQKLRLDGMAGTRPKKSPAHVVPARHVAGTRTSYAGSALSGADSPGYSRLRSEVRRGCRAHFVAGVPRQRSWHARDEAFHGRREPSRTAGCCAASSRPLLSSVHAGGCERRNAARPARRTTGRARSSTSTAPASCRASRTRCREAAGRQHRPRRSRDPCRLPRPGLGLRDADVAGNFEHFYQLDGISGHTRRVRTRRAGTETGASADRQRAVHRWSGRQRQPRPVRHGPLSAPVQCTGTAWGNGNAAPRRVTTSRVTRCPTGCGWRTRDRGVAALRSRSPGTHERAATTPRLHHLLRPHRDRRQPLLRVVTCNLGVSTRRRSRSTRAWQPARTRCPRPADDIHPQIPGVLTFSEAPSTSAPTRWAAPMPATARRRQVGFTAAVPDRCSPGAGTSPRARTGARRTPRSHLGLAIPHQPPRPRRGSTGGNQDPSSPPTQ